MLEQECWRWQHSKPIEVLSSEPSHCKMSLAFSTQSVFTRLHPAAHRHSAFYSLFALVLCKSFNYNHFASKTAEELKSSSENTKWDFTQIARKLSIGNEALKTEHRKKLKMIIESGIKFRVNRDKTSFNPRKRRKPKFDGKTK